MDPLTLALIGGGSSLASMFFNSQAQDQVDAARNTAIQTDRNQQAALDAQAKVITDGSLARFNNFDTQQAADATKLSNYYTTPAPTPTDPNLIAALPSSTNAVVNREIANKGSIASAFGQQQGQALGKLQSFGDLMGNIGRSQASDDQAVGELGNFKQGDTNVEKIALDNANRAGNTDAAIGNLLGGVGKVALTAGFSGKLATPGLGTIGSTTSAANVPFYAPADI